MLVNKAGLIKPRLNIKVAPGYTRQILCELIFTPCFQPLNGIFDQSTCSKTDYQTLLNETKSYPGYPVVFCIPSPCTFIPTTINTRILYTENKISRIRNFEKVINKQGKHEGAHYDDPEVYEAIEAIACSLKNGYLNTNRSNFN